MRSIIFIFFIMNASSSFGFGSVFNAKITSIRVDNGGQAMIFFNEPIGGEPAACVHSSYTNALGVDANTPGGQAVLSLALTAKTTGSPVVAHGLGVCGVYGGNVIETWNHGFIN